MHTTYTCSDSKLDWILIIWPHICYFMITMQIVLDAIKLIISFYGRSMTLIGVGILMFIIDRDEFLIKK